MGDRFRRRDESCRCQTACPHGLHAVPAGPGWDRDACPRGREEAVRRLTASTSPFSRLTELASCPREVLENITVLRVPAWPRARDYYLAPGIAAVVGQRHRWDLVHCQGIHTPVPILAMLAARRARHSLPRDLPHRWPFTGVSQCTQIDTMAACRGSAAISRVARWRKSIRGRDAVGAGASGGISPSL